MKYMVSNIFVRSPHPKSEIKYWLAWPKDKNVGNKCRDYVIYSIHEKVANTKLKFPVGIFYHHDH